MYRLEIDSIQKQVVDKNFPILISLKTNACNKFIYDLISKNIILCPKIIVKEDKLADIINTKCTHFLSSEVFVQELLEKGIIDDENDATQLLDELKNKKWIRLSSLEQLEAFYKNLHFERILLLDPEQWKTFFSSVILPIYSIVNSSSLLAIEKIKSRLQLSDKYKSITLTLASILNNKLTMASADVKKHIINVITRAKSSLLILDHPAAFLQSFDDIKLGGELGLEIEIFKLNGFNHTIVTFEKKYTFNMIKNILGVVLLGMVQCVVGFAVLVYSTGTMTHFGNALISEGIGDLVYAAFCFESGNFSWSDYGKHKLASVAMSAATFGCAAYFSKGKHLSRYGFETAGKGFITEKGTDLALTKGADLIKNIGIENLIQIGGKHILGKLAESFVMAGFNYFADNTIKNAMNSLCRGLASKIIGEIDQNLYNHEISSVLTELIKTCGPSVAKSQVTTSILNNFGSDSVFWKDFVTFVGKIYGAAITGKSEASKKISRANVSTFEKCFANDSTPSSIFSNGSKYALSTGNILLLKNTINNALQEYNDRVTNKNKR